MAREMETSLGKDQGASKCGQSQSVHLVGFPYPFLDTISSFFSLSFLKGLPCKQKEKKEEIT
jgi:hypothetical protein